MDSRSSLLFQTSRLHIRSASYIAAGAGLSLILSAWLTRYSAAVLIGASVCGLLSFSLSVLQIRTKRDVSFLHLLFSVFSMLTVAHHVVPPDHREDAIWQFGSVYFVVWLGLVFLLRRALMRRLEVTHSG